MNTNNNEIINNYQKSFKDINLEKIDDTTTKYTIKMLTEMLTIDKNKEKIHE